MFVVLEPLCVKMHPTQRLILQSDLGGWFDQENQLHCILLWRKSTFKNNTNLCDSITQKMLLDSLFVALVNYLEYYYAIIICLFTKIFPARGSKASTLLNGENSYLIRWINSFSLLLRDWSIQMKHYMTYYCWCIIPKTF